MWTGLQSELQLIIRRNCKMAQTPTNEQLDDLENIISFKLPTSFREFAKIFGAGELGGTFRIGACGYPKPKRHWPANIIDINHQCHTSDAHLKDERNAHLTVLSSMIYFCTTTDGTAIAWSPNEVTDNHAKEYKIYVRMRDDSFHLLSTQFDTFIHDICLGGGYDRKMIEFGYVVEEPTPTPKNFVPIQVPIRSRRR